MTVEPNRAENLAGTVVIADFGERRARDVARSETSSDEILAPGTKVGRYLIIERLGGGGMGVVYKAQDTELRRTVALKVLPPHLCRQPDALNRFRAEAQAQARLNSSHVVMLYSMLDLPEGEVLVLEYVEGETLEQRLKRTGPLSAEAAVRIFDQVLRAVDHIHAAGVVHRDLKPGNIFLTRDGRVKVMDFGVAKILDQPDLGDRRTMVGTLLYISPEQINGHATDFRSDIYTLGVSLFETVTGRLPFERRSDYALMHAHVQERPPRPKEYRRIPAALESVILRAIEKDPSRRFATAGEFRRGLLRLGLVERRQRTAARREDVDAGLAPRSLAAMLTRAPQRLLGGMWLDAALVITVVGLVYTLGLFPIKSTPTNAANPGAPVSAISPAAAAAPKTPARVIKRSGDISPAPAASSPSANRYDSLRDAWSN